MVSCGICIEFGNWRICIGISSRDLRREWGQSDLNGLNVTVRQEIQGRVRLSLTVAFVPSDPQPSSSPPILKSLYLVFYALYHFLQKLNLYTRAQLFQYTFAMCNVVRLRWLFLGTIDSTYE